MQTNYVFTQSLIPVATASTVDLLINFSAETTSDRPPRRPLNLSIVIDRSGSMAGQPLKQAISAAKNLVERLTPEDFVSIVTYDDTPTTILQPVQAQDKGTIYTLLERVKAGGCTNLSGGWLMGCDRVKLNQSTERINRVLLLTDGQANQGIVDPQVLINTAREQAETGIVTTTLGFGTYFNEDLLISMANAAGGNFYFIQSPDDASDVFRIELESLLSVVAQNLTATIQPAEFVQINGILNNYRTNLQGKNLEVFLGDVYEVEAKQLALELNISPNNLGETNIATVAYTYQAIAGSSIQQFTDQIAIAINVGSAAEASNIQPDLTVLQQVSQLRIAKVKDEAIALADKGDYNNASQKLRQTISDLKLKALDESFAVAEEIEQLDYYAQRLESKRFDTASRKEMRDQSYQARSRDRGDLKLRGIVSGSSSSLEAVSSAEQGVVLRCDREGGKLRIRVVSDGYNPDFNVQFPRSIRDEGVTYVVDEVKLSSDGSFYRTSGNIRVLVLPGQERKKSYQNTTTPRTRQKLNAPQTAADLETVDSVGDGVLVQCVKEGSKLRARVVSDGYDPNYNMRFPRDIREENVLYVVDEVEEAKNGGSYIAYGKIRRLIQ